MEPIGIGISEKGCEVIAQRLNVLLANEYILYTKTLKFHWNVVGANFGPLHALFEKQYLALFEIIDDAAERVRSLGSDSLGTLQEFLDHTILHEHPAENPDDRGMIEHLVFDHEAVIRQIREDIDLTVEYADHGTNNFLADIIEKHEKMAWMLRAHLQSR